MSVAAHADGVLEIFTTVALSGVLKELEPAFRQEHGRSFAMTFGPGGVTSERVRSGGIADVVVSSPPTLTELTEAGFLVPGSTAEIARSIVGVAVPAGAPKPRIDSVEHFRQALLDAKIVAYTNPATGAASGVHFVKVLERLGITDAINAKARLGSGGPVAEFLARGEATLAIQQICEHMLVPGVEVVGPVPAELQAVTTLGVALHARAPSPEPARALIAVLLSERGQSIMGKHGLERAA
jgi:molybdate transport system substrate-binding protein